MDLPYVAIFRWFLIAKPVIKISYIQWTGRRDDLQREPESVQWSWCEKTWFYVLYFTAELTEVRILKVDLVAPHETTCWILLHLKALHLRSFPRELFCALVVLLLPSHFGCPRASENTILPNITESRNHKMFWVERTLKSIWFQVWVQIFAA